MIVEDEGDLSDALARRFARRGFFVLETASPLVAIQHLRDKKADLVICDINLKVELSGLDVFHTMKAENLTVPFVFFTGHGEGTKEVQTALEAGADGVFSKPTDFPVLLQKVCVLLGLASDAVSLAHLK